jgi:hypothetical protein
MIDTSPDPSAPPRDSVWTKYSPNHEFPISLIASIAMHGLVVALIFWIFMWVLLPHWQEAPPVMNVAMMADGPGDGLPPGGGNPPGTPGNPIEDVNPKQPPRTAFDPPQQEELIQVAPPTAATPFRLPVIGDAAKETDLNDTFNKIEKDLKAGSAPKPRPNVGKGNGGGGQGGGGKGIGQGPGEGPGSGIGGSAKATRAEILAKRWNFLLGGESSEHMKKLIAAGIKIGFVDGNNLFWVVRDLKKRPVEYQKDSIETYSENVKWWNTHPPSVDGLTRELGLPVSPRAFVMFLPGDREQVLADAEHQFAKARNRDMKQVTETWFDFRVVGGAIEPVVVGQVPFEPRPKWSK